MAVSLGKRKRSALVAAQDVGENSDDDADAKARFQQAFEAKFKPLEVQPIEREASELENNEDIVESEWSGIESGSEDDEDSVEVFDHGFKDSAKHEIQMRELRDFMSSKPPTSNDKPTINRTAKGKTQASDAENEGEATNLKHDLALQRLLRESHLLDRPSNSTTSQPLEATGRSRLKALDLRLAGLGSKSSASAFSQQEKMPLAHRKGIQLKAETRERNRRREAEENGIVLERKAKGSKRDEERVKGRRTGGVGAPGVGKFKGGTLTLSQSDVRRIEGKDEGKKGRRRGR